MGVTKGKETRWETGVKQVIFEVLPEGCDRGTSGGGPIHARVPIHAHP